MGPYIALFLLATVIFIGFIFYEKHRFDKLTYNIYKIILVEDCLVSKNLIKVTVQSNDKEPVKSAVLGKDKKYIKGSNVILHSKTKNGKEVLIPKTNFKMTFLHLFFTWLACVIMLILTYFGARY